MTEPDILAALTPVIDALEQLGVEYHIGGSVASSVHGVARSTLDVDLVADLQDRHARPLFEQLREGYYVDEDMIRDAVRRHAPFNVVHLATMLKIDVFVLKPLPFEQEVFARRRADTLEDREGAREFHLATPEDIVLHKLQWYRLGDEISERQWRDAVGVLQVQAGALDLGYLRRWAAAIEVGDLLERALVDAADTEST